MNFQCKLTLMPLAFTQITNSHPYTYLHKLLMLSLLVHHHEWHFCKTIATQKESSNAFIIHLSNKPDMYFANTTCIPFVESRYKLNVDVCILISKYKNQEMYRPNIIYFIENRFPFSDRIEWIEKLYLPLNNWAQAFVYIFFCI